MVLFLLSDAVDLSFRFIYMLWCDNNNNITRCAVQAESDDLTIMYRGTIGGRKMCFACTLNRLYNTTTCDVQFERVTT